MASSARFALALASALACLALALASFAAALASAAACLRAASASRSSCAAAVTSVGDGSWASAVASDAAIALTLRRWRHLRRGLASGGSEWVMTRQADSAPRRVIASPTTSPAADSAA